MKRKKHVLVLSCLLPLLCLLSFFAMFPLSMTSSTDRGSEWMKDMDDDVSLTNLSIPGSHDSGALHSIGDLSGKCQDLSILGQLKAGVRYFDIRLKQSYDDMEVVHGFLDQKMDFSSVLEDFKTFLVEHPSEGLLVSIKKESEDKSSKSSFDSTLKRELSTYSSFWNLERELPQSLGSLIGKIYLISRYKDNTIGLPAYTGWTEQKDVDHYNTFDIPEINLHVQDYYKVKDIEKKKQQISECLDYSMEHASTLTFNFTSCYFVDSFPPDYSGTCAKEINSWVSRLLDGKKNVGILVSDFVTSDLCEAIYMRNSK